MRSCALPIARASKRRPIRVRHQSERCAARVVWLKEPIDPATGKPQVDSKNVDPAKNGQPVLGMQGVFDMHPAHEPDQWDGRVYSIDDGKIYDGNIIMHSDNELYIQGCFMLFCRGEKWVRQDVPDLPKPAAPPAKQPQARAR